MAVNHRNIISAVALGIIIVSCSTPILEESPEPESTSYDLVAALDLYLSDLADKHQFGGAVLVGKEGKILFAQGYGLASIKSGLQNSPQTRFLIGSMDKSFTAMAILILQTRGDIELMDGICSYLQRCPPDWEDITIHHLLTHTSGIPDFPPDITVLTNHEDVPLTPSAITSLYMEKPLRFNPGDIFGYSTPGYIVLQMIIESISGIPYPLFLKENIFDPLGMNNSEYACSPSDLPTGHTSYGTVSDLVLWPTAYSVCTTAEDLFLWDQALYSETLVPYESLETMFASYTAAPSFGNMDYGYGWFVGDWLGHRIEGHGGWIPGSGFRSFIQRYPEEQVVVIVLSNQEDVDAFSISTGIASLVLGEYSLEYFQNRRDQVRSTSGWMGPGAQPILRLLGVLPGPSSRIR
jgi:CubicO group peptidase (beta-lactamase class C family)